MHPIAYKVGVPFTLCGTALLFACTFAHAQRINRDVNPANVSVGAAVAGIDEQSNEPPASPKVTKPPFTFSNWTPQAVKQPRATAAWSRQAGTPDANVLLGDGSLSAPTPVTRPPAVTPGGSQSRAKAIEADRNVAGGNLGGSLPAQTGSDASKGPLNFRNLFSSTLSGPARLSIPFDRMPVGDSSNLSFPTSNFSRYRYQAVQKHREARPQESVPALGTPFLLHSKAKSKP